MATMPVRKGFYVSSGFGPRWGTVHYGTDFGVQGGSGGEPIYAIKDGTVTASGPATGFGRWINIDHPGSVGGGLSVYGHVIPEVNVGQKVAEGQRIGRIDPSQATNGGVSPHLHLEFHRYVWSPPGPDRLDPMKTVLVGAGWPGESSGGGGGKHRQPETIYGIDISNHQNGFSITRAREEGFKFVLIKATEGTWLDPIMRSHLEEAKSLDIHYGVYVYVRHDATPRQHADALHAHLGETNVPVALDIEEGAGSDPNHWRAIRDEIEAKGYRVFLTYLPNWYWNKVGSPDLSGLPPLWTSNYPSTRQAYASVLYSTAGRAGWNGYGGLDVKVWQFSDRAAVAGWHVDANAFEGSQADLDALFMGESAAQHIDRKSVV